VVAKRDAQQGSPTPEPHHIKRCFDTSPGRFEFVEQFGKSQVTTAATKHLVYGMHRSIDYAASITLGRIAVESIQFTSDIVFLRERIV
jgi:hypothetical protein